MSNRTVILFAVAVLMAAVTAMVVHQRMKPAVVADVPAPAQLRILVAKHPLAPGSFINPQADFDFSPVQPESIREFHLQEGKVNIGDYQGAVIRRGVKAGEPLTDGLMVKRGSGGFMPAVLEPGKRAVSIAVSATSGNAGFVSPGDFVDLILTHRVRVEEGGAGTGSDSVMSETFVENARVIAIDQMLDNPDNKAVLAKTVTVEVSPRDAEKINVAQDLGKVSISLRSLAVDGPAEKQPAEQAADAAAKPAVPAEAQVVDPFFMENVPAPAAAPVVTSDRDLSKALSDSSEVSPRVRVIRGNQVETLRFYKETP